MSSTVSLPPVKKIGIIVCFRPMACYVFGMTAVGDRANIFKDDSNIETRIRHLLRLLQNGSLLTRVEFVASL
jgi:hypothetical protein